MRKEFAEMRKNDKYCEYHKDISQTTTSCRNLARAINQITKDKGIKEISGPPKVNQEFLIENSKSDNTKETIFVIMGGKGNHDERKKLKIPHIDSITDFSDKDLEGVIVLHQDPLVIFIAIEMINLLRVLVDTRAFIDIMYWDVFKNL